MTVLRGAGFSWAAHARGCFEEKGKLNGVSQHHLDTKDDTAAASLDGLSSLPPSEMVLIQLITDDRERVLYRTKCSLLTNVSPDKANSL